ncbi:hypothetical protein SUGI_0324430 [Cryptomeria japonica]|uniref:uncharacterized protein LOC131066354 isoform X2 n=1 Tax=Cryptomeria japonica TaxID=3369 RepID=UPI002408CE02|nr:uncharacterized protein LOC131066354 isoform X2 [Cryptomeria japonica]GLJ18328.1 hypothetical protein SUGI_0324430 [Cryptomeria japonica]
MGAQVSSCGFLVCLLCLLTTLLLHGGSSAQFGGSLPEDGAVSMSDGAVSVSEVENGRFSEMKGKNVNIKDEIKINDEDGERMHEMIDMDRGRELIFNIDYHGPTTHPPATPEKRPPGTGPH